MNELEITWKKRLELLDIAFQPIVNIHTGELYGVEALLRGVEHLGFNTIESLFDQAYNDDVLYAFDLALREKVIKKFIHIENSNCIKLFINLDNRLLKDSDFSAGNTAKILKNCGLDKEMICFELSERHEISNPILLEHMLEHYKAENYSIAIDDFGSGYAGYKLLYQSTPDFIKIDRFFMGSICRDEKKRILVQSVVSLATELGITVVAEGIETETELITCRELGCHLVQGYFVQKPTLNIEELVMKYKHVENVLGETNHLERFIDAIPAFSYT